MTDWTFGYRVDIDYTYGYYTELNPQRLCLAFLNAGLAYPKSGAACELGFGQGMSVNLHAAASTTQWWATDFNPSHAGFAQELATGCGASARLFDQSFAEFCNRSDLPEFDYIGVHGIWSWISDENRAVIVDFLRRKLKVSGVLYISYNAQPGWAAMAPMRDLLSEHFDKMGINGQGTFSRVEGALAFAEKLFAVNPAYARANPQVAERVKKLKEQNRNYVAHEYFNGHWEPMTFSRVAEWLAPAKLSYACSAHYPDHIDIFNLTAEQQALLKEIPDAVFRETVRDFCVNQQFRRDYWVKGPRKLNQVTQAAALRAQQVVLVQPRADVSLKVKSNLGEATLQEPIYQPILDILADHQPKTLGQIEQAVKLKNITLSTLMQAVMILIGSGVLVAVQDQQAIRLAKPVTKKLNTYLCRKAIGGGEIGYLASPVTGGGITVTRVSQLFLLAKSLGKAQPADWVAFAWGQLSAQGQRLIKDGKALESEADNLAELTTLAKLFAAKQLPVLQALEIV